MRYIIQAACGCSMGRIRENNEDNFYFDGRCLEQDNEGLANPVTLEEVLKSGQTFAVFDGVGGENFGEEASFTAARQLQLCHRTLADFFVSERRFLERTVGQLNDAVREKQQLRHAGTMSTTMVSLYFSGRYVYVCNVGDSRAYRLREGEFIQLSQDHLEKRPDGNHKKGRLTRYLGFDTDEVQLEPFIAKGQIRRGDRYLLCSDGLTDMLTNFEITDILLRHEEPEDCVRTLIRAALENGGRDNVTAIVCRIE